MKLIRIKGQSSWRFTSDQVEAAITQQGGHLAPIRFHLPHGIIAPYSVAPWAEEKPADKIPHLLRLLRGDFFCAPFGGSESLYRGEKHPPHGETANATWKLESFEKTKAATELKLSLETKVRRGRVDKTIRLRQGETALYCRHVLSGMAGKMNLGHHATLKFPDAPGSGLIDTSPISFAQVLPGAFEKPAEGGYTSLKPGALFSELDKVPALDGTMADLSRARLRGPGDDDARGDARLRLDGGDFPRAALRLVRAEGPTRTPEHRALDIQRRTPLRAVERTPRQRHGPRGRDLLFSSRPGGIGATEPGQPARHRDSPDIEGELSPHRKLHHGGRGDSPEMGPGEIDHAGCKRRNADSR
jgi:hypothetical protein